MGPLILGILLIELKVLSFFDLLFHYCLRYILDGLETIQQSNDMYNWVFRFPGNKVKKYSRKLIFFLSHVVSDAKENDMISPFEEKQIRGDSISYGLSSFGYDARVADEF